MIKPLTMGSVLMTFLAMLGLWHMELSFNMDPDMEMRLATMSKRVVEKEMKSQLLQARFDDFKQEVAVHFHDVDSRNFSSQMRSLASIIPHNFRPDRLAQAQSRKRFNEGKELFDAQKFEEASERFLDLISKYPESPIYLKTSYYLVRCFYETNNRQESVDWAQKLLKMYPDSLWTAEALLVMADIYHEQDRDNDALDVYSAIVNTFNDKSLKNKVRERIVKLGL